MPFTQRLYDAVRAANTTNVIATILVTALAVRAVLAISAWLVTNDLTVFHSPDTISYLAPAREMLSSGTFTVRGEPELVRTPGYPLLLLPGLWLGQLEGITIALQIALSVVTVAGVFVLANRVLDNERTALVAAALYAIEPLSVVYSVMLLTETLFTALIVWGMAFVVKYIRDSVTPSLVVGTVLLAASAYVRPASYFLPFLLLALLGVSNAVRHNWRVFPRLAAAAASAIAAVAPWQLRNRALGFDGMSAITVESVYFYHAAAVRAAHSGRPFREVQAAMGYSNDSLYVELHPEQRGWTPGHRFEFMAADGRREVLQDLPLSARIYLSGSLRVLLDPGAIDLLKLHKLYPASGGLLNTIVTHGLAKGLAELLRTNAIAIALLALLGLALAGSYAMALRWLVASKRLLDPTVMLLVATAVYFIAISGGPAGLNRFRHPVMPFVCVWAAAGLATMARARQPSNS